MTQPVQDLKVHSSEAPDLPYLEGIINTSKSLLLEEHRVAPMLFLKVGDKLNVLAIPPSAMGDKDLVAKVIREMVAQMKPSSLCLLNDVYLYKPEEGESLDNIMSENGVINKPASAKSEALVYSVTEFENDEPAHRYMGMLHYKRDHNDIPNQLEDIVWFKNGQNDFNSVGRFVI